MNDQYPRLKSTVRLQKLNSGVCVREMWTSGEKFAPVGTGFVLSLCDGNVSAGEIARLVALAFGVSPDGAARFTGEVLDEYAGWLERLETPGGGISRYDMADFAYSAQPLPDSGKLSAPVSASLTLTGKCNFYCAYCFNGSGADGEMGLPAALWREAIRQIGDIGVSKIELTGGEPLIVPGIDDIISQATDTNLLIYLFTNGALIDERRAEFLSDKKNLLTQISLDSAIPDVHHRLTATRDSYSKVLAAITALKRRGANLRVKGLLLPNTYKDAGKLIELCSELGVRELTLDTYDLTYAGRGDISWALTPAQGEEVSEIIESKARSGVRVAFTPPKEHDMWTCAADRSVCGAGTKYMTLSPSGEYSLCDRTSGMPDFSIGYFPELSIKQLWESDSPERMKNPPTSAYDPPCRECEALCECKSGCFAAKRIVTDRPYAADPHCPKSTYENNPYWGR